MALVTHGCLDAVLAGLPVVDDLARRRNGAPRLRRWEG